MKILRKIIKNKKGFALGYVLVILGAVIVFASAFLVASLAENKQSGMHVKNITSFYTAQSGAEIAHLALKHLIETVNNASINQYSWSGLLGVDNYLELLKHSPLGRPSNTSEATLYLNLDVKNDYYLAYSANPIINNLGNSSLLETSITLTPMGQASLEDAGESYVYPLKFLISSKGVQEGVLPNRSTIIGEGMAMIKFTTGNFASYALFMDTGQTKDRQPGWFTHLETFEGPVHNNGFFHFTGFGRNANQNAKFFGEVCCTDRYTWFCNNG